MYTNNTEGFSHSRLKLDAHGYQEQQIITDESSKTQVVYQAPVNKHN